MTLVPGCVSCDLIAIKRASLGGLIYEDDYWHVDSVLGPVYWEGFLIVKLKRHCEHLADLIPEEAAALGPVIQMTCAALTEVLQPAKVYVCSFGDGVKHIHFWVLPRPQHMRPGMHWTMFNLDLRALLTRRFGVKKWLCDETEVAELASRVREQIHRLQHGD